MGSIHPSETEIVGNWILVGNRVDGDEACNRVHELTESVLEHIAFDPQWGAWETLFRDKADGRYWERTYLQSEMHGGGPPSLRCLSKEEAAKKYRVEL